MTQPTNLDGFTSPNMEMEVFNPVNAWAEVEHIFLSVSRGGKGLLWQIGGEIDTNEYFIRFKQADQPWGAWAPFDTPGEPTNVAPTLTSLLPNTAELGGADFTLQLVGTDFTPSSVIMFAGQPEPIVFESAERITTVVKPSLPWGAVTVPVQVKNGSKASGTLDFTFTEPAEAPARSKRSG